MRLDLVKKGLATLREPLIVDQSRFVKPLEFLLNLVILCPQQFQLCLRYGCGHAEVPTMALLRA
jgi:hypothetical protein